MWIGLAPRTDTQFTIQWHRYIQTGWQAAAGAGRGRERNSSAMSTLALQATPLWAGVRQCLLVITHFTQGRGRGGDSTDGLGRAQKTVQERGLFPSWTSAVDARGCRYVHAWAMHGQVELESCRVAGDEGSRREIRSTAHALWVVFCVVLRYCGPLPPSAAEWALALGLPVGLAGWNTGVWSSVLERSAGRVAGWGLGGSWLLGVRRVSSEPHAHSCDKGGPLAAAVFRQEEGYGTLW